MALTLGDLDTRLQALVRDSSSEAQTNRYNALADADLELSSIKGAWRVRAFTYTTTSSPAMAADSYQLNVPTSPAFDSPHRLYYRESGKVRDVKLCSSAEWLERSDTSQSDYPRFARVMHTATVRQLELDHKLSSAFVTNIASLVLEYFIEVTRLSSSGNESILPDMLRHHVVAVAGYKFALTQDAFALAKQLKPDAVLAREAVQLYDLEFIGRPRQIRPVGGYAPSDDEAITSDYGS